MQVVNNYIIDIDKVISSLTALKASRVMIQSPLGLRGVAVKLAEHLVAQGYDVIFSSSNCWGGCDMAYSEAEKANADVLIHLGHSRFLKKDLKPTIYVECRYADPTPIKQLIPKIRKETEKFSSIGLAASVQWLDHLDIIAHSLEESGMRVVRENPSMYAIHTSQVLGCDVSSLKKVENQVEAFLVVGSVFHGLGIAVLTSKPVFAADPHTQKVSELTHLRNRILMQRYAHIEAFKSAENVAVLISIKPGQNRLGLARKVNSLLRKHGKNSFVLTADEITYITITENKFDAFVNTACPRLSVEDQAQFSKPLLLPAEVLVSLGLLQWEYVVENGLLMYPWGWAPRELAQKFWQGFEVLKH